jgi:hypothetical protein
MFTRAAAAVSRFSDIVGSDGVRKPPDPSPLVCNDASHIRGTRVSHEDHPYGADHFRELNDKRRVLLCESIRRR